jgi:hypothetical protein
VDVDQFTNITKLMEKLKKTLVTCIFFFYNFFFPVFGQKNWEFLEIFSFYNVNSINFEKKKNRQFFDITKLEGKNKIK